MNEQDMSQERRGDDGRAAVSPSYDALCLAENETDWARLEAMTDEEALQNALSDPDSLPLTPEQLSRLRRVPNPQAIRLALGLTQEAFARRFEIALGTLRDWEQGAHIPDSTAKAYLRVIAADPDAVVQALARGRRVMGDGVVGDGDLTGRKTGRSNPASLTPATPLPLERRTTP